MVSPDAAVLNAAQAEAVSQLSGPLLVVAGPGSGKTRVLTHRIAALVESGVPASSILAVTFTNKAADEMRSRLDRLLPSGSLGGLWALTFHSACVRLLRRFGADIGLPSRFAIADADDSRRVMRSVLRDLGVGKEELARQTDETAAAISRAKNRLETVAVLTASPDVARRRLAAVMADYDARLRAQNLLDFDDLLLFCLDVLAHQPSGDAVRNRFTHLLIDEFQDTNEAQYEIVRRLVSAGGNVCAVGDLDQSVYAFRSANPELMARFTDDWPTAKVVVLDQNYRSTKRVLAVSQAVIEPVPARHRAHMWTDNELGAPVRVVRYGDDRVEASNTVAELLSCGFDRADCAVLFRTGAQSRLFETELAAASVPYQVTGGLKFYDRAEVRTALAYLRLCANPFDHAALARAASHPRRGIGEKTIEALLAAADGTDPLAFARDHARTAGMRSFVADMDALSGLFVDDALSAVLAIDGFVAAACGKDAPVERQENLEELVAAAAEFRAKHPQLPAPALLDRFLEHVALLSSSDVSDVAGVQLLTVHAAKGREFSAVWVVGVEDGKFPHVRSTTDAEVEEERRLLFVACSRAKAKLTLSFADRRRMFDDVRFCEPSPFLDDLPDDVVRVSHGLDGVPHRAARHARAVLGLGDASLRARGPMPSLRPPPPPKGPRLPASDVRPGVKVSHRTFGVGVVEQVRGDTITVLFDGQRKVLMLQHAPLELA